MQSPVTGCIVNSLSLAVSTSGFMYGSFRSSSSQELQRVDIKWTCLCIFNYC